MAVFVVGHDWVCSMRRVKVKHGECWWMRIERVRGASKWVTIKKSCYGLMKRMELVSLFCHKEAKRKTFF